jgi:DNA-3-methyladenine glycosylase I
MVRCFGDGVGKEFYAEYHDKEWGRPLHDDRRLFEMLVLEGAQAGLSWETILEGGLSIGLYFMGLIRLRWRR